MDDKARIAYLERQLGQAQRVIAGLRKLVSGLETYAPRRHQVRSLARRLRTPRVAA